MGGFEFREGDAVKNHYPSFRESYGYRSMCGAHLDDDKSNGDTLRAAFAHSAAQCAGCAKKLVKRGYSLTALKARYKNENQG